MRAASLCLTALAAALIVACGSEPPSASGAADAASAAATTGDAPRVETAAVPQGTLEAVALELGVNVDADGRVVAPTERVRAADAVHLSLVTVGEAEDAALAVAWRDVAGAAIDADERAITADGPAVHTFTRKPEGGWAPGVYEAEVRINGESAGVRRFEVR